jgi:hypothetical protein
MTAQQTNIERRSLICDILEIREKRGEVHRTSSGGFAVIGLLRADSWGDSLAVIHVIKGGAVWTYAAMRKDEGCVATNKENKLPFQLLDNLKSKC